VLILFVPAIPIALILIQIFPRVPGWLWFIAALVFWAGLQVFGGIGASAKPISNVGR
jgi:hypothetical protein